MNSQILKLLALIITLPVYSQDIPVPNKAQLAWSEAELGVLFSYDLHVFDGRRYNQASNRITPVSDYNIFNPEKLDTDQWIKAAKDAGAKFALLTATHETGFALYQSDVNPYSLKAVKWKDGNGDVVSDFVNSCRKFGIKPGIYIGIRWNSLLGVHDFKVVGEGKFRDNRQAYYRKLCEGMVEELCTRYGDLFEIWFDGGASHPDKGAPDVLPIVKKYQPGALFYHNEQLAEARWGGSESGTVPYPCWSTFPNYYSHSGDTEAERYMLLKHGDPDGKYWMAAMSDAPLRGYNGRHEWFWEPDDEKYIYPLKNLVDMYYKSVGHNSTLILGLTPGPDGLLPEVDVKRLKEFGDEITRRFSDPVASISESGKIIYIKLNKKSTINTLVIQEDISQGQRVREYTFEARLNGRWEVVATGTSIGNKRIQEFDPVEAREFRLIITSSTKEPRIKEFSLFNIDDDF